MQLAEAQDTRTAETIQVDTSLRKRPPRPRPMPPVKRGPEPSASLDLGMALFALAGYGWWSQKKNQVQHQAKIGIFSLTHYSEVGQQGDITRLGGLEGKRQRCRRPPHPSAWGERHRVRRHRCRACCSRQCRVRRPVTSRGAPSRYAAHPQKKSGAPGANIPHRARTTAQTPWRSLSRRASGSTARSQTAPYRDAPWRP